MAGALITSTQSFGAPGAPQFSMLKHGMIQELPFATPYDHADRWQLSKLCAKLGIAHRDAERKVVLVQAILMAEEGGQINREHALGLLDQIIRQMTRRAGEQAERAWVELETPAINRAGPAAPAPVVPPSPESELWRLARLSHKDLLAEAKRMGLSHLTLKHKRGEMLDELEKYLKK